MRWIALLCLSAAPAAAQDCPPAPDHTAEYAEIFTDLKLSRGAAEAQALSARLWELWLEAPDAKAQALLDEGMAKRQSFDLLGARDTLDRLVEYCPDYAEGYNQRAFASYLRQDYDAALVDLDRALAITPTHLGALSGKGLTLMGLGRDDEAQQVLRETVRLNPWAAERNLITGPLEQDI